MSQVEASSTPVVVVVTGSYFNHWLAYRESQKVESDQARLWRLLRRGAARRPARQFDQADLGNHPV